MRPAQLGGPLELGDGTAKAVAQTYASEAPRLRRLFARHGLATEADDLVQDAFVRLSGRPQPERPAAYLTRVAVNLMRDHAGRLLRRRAREHVSLDAAPPLAVPDLPRQLEARDMLVRLERAMLQLKPKTREIFMAHRLDGLTYAEIAAATGLSVKAVEKQMSYAIARLDDLLGPRR